MQAVLIGNNQSSDLVGMALARGSSPYKIAYQLRKFDYTAKVIDFVNPTPNQENDIAWDNLAAILKRYITSETLMLGFSMTFWGEPNVKMLAKIMQLARDINPKIKILIGGAVTTYNHFHELNHYIDGIVSGYAENLAVELMDYFAGKCGEPEFSYAYNQRIKVYEHSRYQHYDFTNCDFVHHESDNIQQGEALSIELSRGCIFKCKFCDYQYLGKKKIDYMRDLNLVRRELEHNYYNYGTLTYNITDSTFNETSDKLSAFADMIESLPFKPNFNAFIRPDLLARYPDMIDNMERANFTGAFFGLETLNRKNSLMIGKGWNGTHEARKFLEYISKRWHNKIVIHANMIVGLPHETADNCRDSKNYLNNIGIPSWYFTPLYIRRDLRFATSEFDRNYDKYGFYFDNDNKWYHSSGWTQDLAHKVSIELYTETMTHRPVPFFWYAPFVTSKTNTIEELLVTEVKDLDWIALQKNQQKFLKQYYTTI